MQTKIQSAIEVIASTCVAFCLNVGIGQLLYPVYSMHPSVGTNAELTLWFTVISIVRGYVTRRFFNWLRHRG